MSLINRIVRGVLIAQTTLASFSTTKYPYNINQEEYAGYLKKVERAEKQIEKNEQVNRVPRRKRRVYDRPKHDLDITNYSAWRIYDPAEMLYKFWAHGAPVATKIQLQPKWVLHAFGMGYLPLNHQKSASLQFSFEDCNFSKFLLYEYRNTTTWAPNIPNYNYEDQSHLPQKRRKTFRLTPEEFWKSEAYFEFRLNCSQYAQKFKFKEWVIKKVQESKSKESYDQFIDKKFGPVVNYNKKEDRKNFEAAKPAILCLTPQHYSIPKKGEKLKEPKVELPKKLEEQYRILRKKTETVKEEAKVQAESKG